MIFFFSNEDFWSNFYHLLSYPYRILRSLAGWIASRNSWFNAPVDDSLWDMHIIPVYFWLVVGWWLLHLCKYYVFTTILKII